VAPHRGRVHQGAITFYKDGVATADQLTAGSPQQAAGDLQLGAGFGATTGFVGQLHGARIWSVARTAGQIATCRWAQLVPIPSGLTVATSFDPVSRRSSTWSAAAGPVQAERPQDGMWSLTIKAT
jgi:Concanavalin A-like lectin/glucanases superfamily